MYTITVDHGAGNLKVKGALGHIIEPTRAATVNGERLGRSTGLRRASPPLQIASEGWQFYVGENAHDWGRAIENLDDARFATGAPGVKAITYAALTRYMQLKSIHYITDVEMWVALPQTALSEDTGDATARGVRAWLEGPHTWTADGESYNLEIDKVKITTQVAGAMFDYLLTDDGAYIPARTEHFKGEMGIISIGMNTVELLGIKNRTVSQRFTKGETLGVRRLLDLTDPQQLYTRGELDNMLRSGSLDIGDALPIWAAEVAGMIEKRWGNAWKRFSAVIAVGGGALLLRDMLLTTFNGKAYIPEDPVMSIANGLYKLSNGHKRSQAV